MGKAGPSPHLSTPFFQTFPDHRFQKFLWSLQPQRPPGQHSALLSSHPPPYSLHSSHTGLLNAIQGTPIPSCPPRPLHWLLPLPKMLFSRVPTEPATPHHVDLTQISPAGFLPPPDHHVLQVILCLAHRPTLFCHNICIHLLTYSTSVFPTRDIALWPYSPLPGT